MPLITFSLTYLQEGLHAKKRRTNLKGAYYRNMILELKYEITRRTVRAIEAMIDKNIVVTTTVEPDNAKALAEKEASLATKEAKIAELQQQLEAALEKSQTPAVSTTEAALNKMFETFNTFNQQNQLLFKKILDTSTLKDQLVSQALENNVRKFDGHMAISKKKDALEAWLTEMNTCFDVIKSSGQAESLTDTIKISMALTRVTQSVVDWMQDAIVPSMESLTWEEFVAKLHEKYDPVDIRLHPYLSILQIDLAQRKIDGDFDKLLHEYEKVLSKIEGFTDDAKIAYLRNAIKPCSELSFWIEAKEPSKTYEEEKKKIREKAKQLSQKTAGNPDRNVLAVTICDICSGYHKTDKCRCIGKVKRQQPEFPRGRHRSAEKGNRGYSRSPPPYNQNRGNRDKLTKAEIKKRYHSIVKEEERVQREKMGRENFYIMKEKEFLNRQDQMRAHRKGETLKRDPHSNRSRKAMEQEYNPDRKKSKYDGKRDPTPARNSRKD